MPMPALSESFGSTRVISQSGQWGYPIQKYRKELACQWGLPSSTGNNDDGQCYYVSEIHLKRCNISV